MSCGFGVRSLGLTVGGEIGRNVYQGHIVSKVNVIVDS